MEINYELTQRDFTESLAVHRNRRPVVKWVRWVVMWVMLLTSAFLLFGAIRTGNTRTLMPFFGLVAFWLLLMSGLLSRWSARRQFVKQPGAHGPRTLLMNEAGTHWRWNGGSSDVE
jgi:lipopolysaccharide export LptBFGC system permease protein LptF